MDASMFDAVPLSNTLEVFVEIGEYGKYLRFKRNNTWITLNIKTWKFLKNNIPMLSSTFTNGGEWGVMLTNSKTVKIGQHRGQSYVSLHEETISDGKTYNTFINLNASEWNSLLFNLSKFDDMIARECQYAIEGGDWCFMEDMIDTDEHKGNIKRRLVQRNSKASEITLLYAVLIAKELSKYLRENCMGCEINAPDQLSHIGYGSGCLCEWSDAVLLYFRMMKKNVCLEKAVEIVKEKMEWELEIEDVDKDMLYNLVMSYNDLDYADNADDDSPITNLSKSYKELFEYLICDNE